METTTQDRPIENAFQHLHFSTIRPIARGDVPSARKREQNSGLRTLEVAKDFKLLLDHVRAEMVPASEVLGELDLSGKDVKLERVNRKSFAGTFKSLLKSMVKEHGLEKQIDVVEREHGTRFFVVGKAA
jgi:hypothetical protein